MPRGNTQHNTWRQTVSCKAVGSNNSTPKGQRHNPSILRRVLHPKLGRGCAAGDSPAPKESPLQHAPHSGCLFFPFFQPPALPCPHLQTPLHQCRPCQPATHGLQRNPAPASPRPLARAFTRCHTAAAQHGPYPSNGTSTTGAEHWAWSCEDQLPPSARGRMHASSCCWWPCAAAAAVAGNPVLLLLFRPPSQPAPPAPHCAGAGFGKASRCFCFSVGSFTLSASPSTCSSLIQYQVMSNCHHSSPWRALNSKAWWLLCQPAG